MTREQGSLLGRIRTKLAGAPSGHGPAVEPKVAASGPTSSPHRIEVPAETNFFSGPPNASAYVNLPETMNGVRLRKPSGTLPGRLEYSRERGTPPPITARQVLPPEQWQFFRNEQLSGPCRPWVFPSSLDNPNCQWLQAMKRLYAQVITFPASISPEGGMLLHSIVRNLQPRVVVETGTFLGASAMWIASALKENGFGVLHCYDDFVPIRAAPWRLEELHEGVLDKVTSHIADAGLTDHVVIHPGNTSHEIRASLDELKAAGGVDLAYLDADHRPLGVCQDFWAVEPILRTGGLVMLHDTFPSVCGDTGPRFLLDNVNGLATGTYQALDLYLAPFNYGLGVMRRVG